MADQSEFVAVGNVSLVARARVAGGISTFYGIDSYGGAEISFLNSTKLPNLGLQQISEAYKRTINSDVKYRFVLDCKQI